jgi:hypothetical protein
MLSLMGAAAQAKPLKLKFEKGMPKEQIATLTEDLAKLYAMTIPSPDKEMLRILGMKDGSGASMTLWLSDRVQYVVGQDYDLASNVRPSAATLLFKYPNPGVFPNIEEPTRELPSDGSVKVVMANIGTALYFAGKQSGFLLKAGIEGTLNGVDMRSPRTGLLQVGDGLFSPGKKLEAASPTVRRLYRLETLFHEARHSDGNGKSLGFLHASCAPGHDLEGLPACDRNLNGPYTVGAHMIKALGKACTDCSAADKELIKLISADSFNRVIKEYPDPNEPAPATPDQQIETLRLLVGTCNTLNEVGIADSEDCTRQRKQLADAEADPSSLEIPRKMIKTTEWDATPEGKR